MKQKSFYDTFTDVKPFQTVLITAFPFLNFRNLEQTSAERERVSFKYKHTMSALC